MTDAQIVALGPEDDENDWVDADEEEDDDEVDFADDTEGDA